MRALFVSAIALTLTAAAPSSIGFGDRVAPMKAQPVPYVTVDLDGDGAFDTVYVVSVAPGKALPTDLTVISNLWSSPWRTNTSTKRALAIVLGKTQRKYLLADPNYFD